MKNVCIFFLVLLPVIGYAQTIDNQLIDAREQQEPTRSIDVKFAQFQSCEQMDIVLEKYIKELRDSGIFSPMPMYRDYMAVDMMPSMGMPVPESSTKMSSEDAMGSFSYVSQKQGFSTTNLQKQGVEEPEIIKTDGKYIYYYNRQEHLLYVLRSPFDVSRGVITIDNASIETIIKIPVALQSIQLFVTNNRLIILGTRYRTMYERYYTIDRSQRTTVAVYDTSSTPKLMRFTDVDGYYIDARMVVDNLYLLTQMGVNWYRYADTTRPMPEISEQSFLPKSVDVINGKMSVTTPDCANISYILPSIETVKQTNMHPAFTLVSVIDTRTPTTPPTTHVMLAQPGQIHMTHNSLYLVQNIRTYNNRRCPADMFCGMPVWQDGSQTLIHKFSVQNKNVIYQQSALVPGQLLTQYSMDEDLQGNFRILTKKYSPRVATDLYILDSKLQAKGLLTNIEPGEDFKSSRYIGDKLYLVTFEQIDPLFVIDMVNPAQPKIIGELKVPGYSTYLYPMGSLQGGKQYLIGLGYDVKTNQWGGIQNAGIQLALYEVDYLQKETVDSKCSSIKNTPQYESCVGEINPSNIRVSKVADYVLGGVGSYSESLDNPRMFVINSKNEVTLPMVLQDEMVVREDCTRYPTKMADGSIIEKEYCQPITDRVTQFAGLKTFSISPTAGIKETVSQDYKDIFAKAQGSRDGKRGLIGWSMYDQSMRVGYAGDSMYMIANDFAHFFLPHTQQGKYLYFDPMLR